jgi:hypothetical protein
MRAVNPSVALDCLYFKRKWSQKVDRATFSTEWKSAFNAFPTLPRILFKLKRHW